MLGISNSYANEVSYTFDEARQIGISNSKEIKLQDEIINSLKNKNDIQKRIIYRIIRIMNITA